MAGAAQVLGSSRCTKTETSANNADPTIKKNETAFNTGVEPTFTMAMANL